MADELLYACIEDADLLGKLSARYSDAQAVGTNATDYRRFKKGNVKQALAHAEPYCSSFSRMNQR